MYVAKEALMPHASALSLAANENMTVFVLKAIVGPYRMPTQHMNPNHPYHSNYGLRVCRKRDFAPAGSSFPIRTHRLRDGRKGNIFVCNILVKVVI